MSIITFWTEKRSLPISHVAVMTSVLNFLLTLSLFPLV